MANRLALMAVLAAALLADACGARHGASGIYLVKAAREVTMVQLVETPDKHIRGRYEDLAIGPGGVVSDVVSTLDGAAAEHELTLHIKPASAPEPGATATGQVSGDTLSLAGPGLNLQAHRSTLEDYQHAVTALQAAATAERRAAATGAAPPAPGGPGASVSGLIAQLRRDSAALDAGVAAAPDYARTYAVNTSRIAALVRRTAATGSADRGPLSAQARQVEVDTNRAEAGEVQYRGRLQLVADGVRAESDRLEQFCGSAAGAPYAAQCRDARAAIAESQASLTRARTRFASFDTAFEINHRQQDVLVRRFARN